MKASPRIRLRFVDDEYLCDASPLLPMLDIVRYQDVESATLFVERIEVKEKDR